MLGITRGVVVASLSAAIRDSAATRALTAEHPKSADPDMALGAYLGGDGR